MAAGGYRAPSHPAAVSGPGALSQRTDTGVADSKAMVRPISGGAYGDRKDFQGIESGAPMAPAPTAQDATPLTPQSAGLIPFEADTTAPDEPVTSGAATGDGAGPEVLGGITADPVQEDAQALAGYLPVYEAMANLPNSSASIRAAIVRLKARL